MTAVPTEGIAITGAQIYFTLPLPIQDLPITEAQINSWMVIISVTGLCLYLTHGMCTKKLLIRQHIAEWIVEKVDRLVEDGMGSYFAGFSPFIAAMLGLSAFSSLLSLCGLFPPTSDLNVVAGWAVLVFVLITFYKCKAGPLEYIKSFANPVAMAPLNIISELATPLSMAFRHYGNVLSGTVISVLIAAGMQGLSRLVLGWIPGALGDFPLFRIGLPAVLSVYFDIFSGCLQAYIFAMLTMMYVSGGFPYEAYMERKNKRNKKKNLEVM
ncbi:MAG: F0F1 ATP synthase subunit A [Ruminococcaceae bacterium]|nr:F0F1 ATP synthase subunit A [Oscillospiraceae bacterium]